MNRIHWLVKEGCGTGFSGAICDEVVAAAEHLYTIRAAAEHLLIEAECVGTVHGHRELLIRVGRLRNAIHDPPECSTKLRPNGEAPQ